MNKAKDVSKLVRQARKSLGLDGKSQQQVIREARNVLKMTTGELAEAIGKSEAALLSWLAPDGNAKARRMPAESRLVLERIIQEHKAAKRGSK